jgi:hypothetical protein
VISTVVATPVNTPTRSDGIAKGRRDVV